MAEIEKQPEAVPLAEGVLRTAASAPVEAMAEPTVRVRLLERYSHVDMRISGNFSLTSLDGDTIYSDINSDLLWRSRVEK